MALPKALRPTQPNTQNHTHKAESMLAFRWSTWAQQNGKKSLQKLKFIWKSSKERQLLLSTHLSPGHPKISPNSAQIRHKRTEIDLKSNIRRHKSIFQQIPIPTQGPWLLGKYSGPFGFEVRRAKNCVFRNKIYDLNAFFRLTFTVITEVLERLIIFYDFGSRNLNPSAFPARTLAQNSNS